MRSQFSSLESVMILFYLATGSSLPCSLKVEAIVGVEALSFGAAGTYRVLVVEGLLREFQ